MRIVSLLPSATEIVCALGLEGDLAGVTDDCDHPPSVREKPVVSRTRMPDVSAPGDIDRVVSGTVASGEALYELDADRIRDIRPDLILAQDLCRVCAVPSGHVEAALVSLGCSAEVLSLDPQTLDDVICGIDEVGRATGHQREAGALTASLRDRVGAVRRGAARLDRPKVLTLEWSDPPYAGGHWVPDMVEVAGGRPLLSETGSPSSRVTWEDIEAAAPDVVVFMPCGYGLEAAVGEAGSLPSFGIARVYAVDATSYFSRPGPRVVDGLEALAWALHPDHFPVPPDGRAVRIA